MGNKYLKIPKRIRKYINFTLVKKLIKLERYIVQNTLRWYSYHLKNPITYMYTKGDVIDPIENTTAVTTENDVMKFNYEKFNILKTDLIISLRKTVVQLRHSEIKNQVKLLIYKVQKYHKVLFKDMSNQIMLHRMSKQNQEYEIESIRLENKLHNFTTRTISKDLMDILNKGPKYVPHQQVKLYDIRKNVKSDLFRCMYKITNVESYGNIYRDVFTTLQDSEMYEQAYSILQDSEMLSNICIMSHINCNTKPSVLASLRQLANDDSIVINISDKNLGFTINDTEWYIHEYNRMFKESDIYILQEDVSKNDIIENSLHKLYDIATQFKNCVTDTDIRYLTSVTKNDIILPSLSLLPKVHKLKVIASPSVQYNLTSRPIVNGYASVNITASKILRKYVVEMKDKLLKKFADNNLNVPIINNSEEFLKNIRNVQWNFQMITNMWLVTFDFESLYTSIKIHHVLDTFVQLYKILDIEENIYRFMIKLCKFIMNNTYFHIGHQFIFKQKSGLAMGSYDSGEIASLVLLYREYKALLDHSLQNIHNLSRYVDDGFCIIEAKNSKELHFTLQWYLKYYPKDINITVSVSKVSIHYLDVYAEIGQQTLQAGHISTRVFQKPFNTYCYPHFDSSIPRSVHCGFIKNENVRYKKISSSKMEFDHMIKLFKIRLRKCMYPMSFINDHMIPFETNIVKQVKTKSRLKVQKIHYDSRFKQVNIIKGILTKYEKYRNKVRFCNIQDRKLIQIVLNKNKMHNKLAKFM